MYIKDKNISINDIDAGKEFDWGKTSRDYALYRDIYPPEFYQYILGLGLCKDGQKCLDCKCQYKNTHLWENKNGQFSRLFLSRLNFEQCSNVLCSV